MNCDLSKNIDESQIYRIDHYLGKETVQNIMVFRFGNSVFEPIWNRRYIEHVQITVAEELGVELRGGYYDHSGVVRDMVQNHILSVLSLIAMEPPSSISGDSVRNEKVKVLEAIRPMEPEEIISKHGPRAAWLALSMERKFRPTAPSPTSIRNQTPRRSWP